MYKRIFSFFPSKHALSLIVIFALLIVLCLVLGSLLQYYFTVWTPSTLRLAKFLVYAPFMLLAISICHYFKVGTSKNPRVSGKGPFCPCEEIEIPENDLAAFDKLFAYGTAIDKGEEHLGRFIDKYQLTDKEEEVMRLLLCSDATIRDLSHDLMVSERVCQRHLTSIYEKTETKSRLALLMKYYD